MQNIITADFRSSFVALVAKGLASKKGLTPAANKNIKTVMVSELENVLNKYVVPTLIGEVGAGGQIVACLDGYDTIYVVNSRTNFGSINPLAILRDDGVLSLSHVELVEAETISDTINKNMSERQKKAQSKLGLSPQMKATYGRGMKTSNIMKRVDSMHNRYIRAAESNELPFEVMKARDTHTFLAGCEVFLKFYYNNGHLPLASEAIDIVLAFKGLMMWYDKPNFDALNTLLDAMDALVVLDCAEMDSLSIDEMKTGTPAIDQIIESASSPSTQVFNRLRKIVRFYTNKGFTFSEGAEAASYDMSWIEDLTIDEMVKYDLLLDSEISEENPDIDFLTAVAVQRHSQVCEENRSDKNKHVRDALVAADLFINAALAA